MSGVARATSRSAAIERVVVDEIRKRRALIDENDGIAVFTVTCYLQEGAEVIRAVAVSEETRHASRRPPRS